MCLIICNFVSVILPLELFLINTVLFITHFCKVLTRTFPDVIHIQYFHMALPIVIMSL